MKRVLPPLSIDDLRVEYDARKVAIRQRLEDFTRVPANEYFYEVAYCLLTPQSSAVNAGNVVTLLRQHHFESEQIDPEQFLARRDSYIRFHRTKSLHLLAMKERYPEIFSALTGQSSSTELREWLVRNVKGMGWKEASHLLRNIGHRDLAILDRHILKNLRRLRVIRTLPPTLTPRRYKLLERKFHTFAGKIGIPMDELDLLFWSMETGEILK